MGFNDLMPVSLLSRALRPVVRAAGALPAPLKRALAGKPIMIDGRTLDPDVQFALRLLNATGDTSGAPSVAQARAALDAEAYVVGAEPAVATADLTIPGPAGPIPARVYGPIDQAPPRAVMVYFHGGGWVLGGLGSADAFARRLVIDADLTVVSIDYRRAPENPFPAAVEDAVAAFRWVRDNAAMFGTTRALVGGESAGGNLACVVAQQTRDDPEGGPQLQLPISPVTDASRRTRSYELFGEGFFLTADHMEWFFDHYVPDEADRRDPRCSPLLAESVAGLAPAVLVVAGFDPLRDEGLAYAKRLEDAGVPCQVVELTGAIHAFVDAQGFGLGPALAAHRISDAVVRALA